MLRNEGTKRKNGARLFFASIILFATLLATANGVSLAKIFSSSSDGDNASSSGKMFTQCKSLSGGKGTSYDAAHTDKVYARIDGGAENPGYFTDIAYKP